MYNLRVVNLDVWVPYVDGGHPDGPQTVVVRHVPGEVEVLPLLYMCRYIDRQITTWRGGIIHFLLILKGSNLVLHIKSVVILTSEQFTKQLYSL